MKIGFIGAGNMAVVIARYALKAGNEVVLTARNADRLAGVVKQLGKGAAAGTPAEVAASDIVVLTVPWPNIKDALAALPPLNGKILVDVTNPFAELQPKLVFADLGGRSASEIVAEYVPAAKLVKAFNTIRAEDFEAGPKRGDARRVLFISGAEADSKAKIKALIQSFGFVAVDLGGLVTGGRLQQAGGALASGEDYLVAGEKI